MDLGRLRRCAAVASNAYRESVRERVLYNLVFFAILMTISGLALRSLSIRQDDKIVKDLGLASMELFGDMIAIFIGVGLVSKEIERRSLYPLLAKPVTRTDFLIGKFAGLSFTLLVNVGVMTLGLYLTLALSGGTPTLHLLKAVYPIYLGLVVIVSIALLSSTVASAAVAGVATTALVVAGHFSDVIHKARTILPSAPGWLLDLLYYAIPNFQTFDLKDRVVYADPVGLQELLWITLYACAYVGVALGLATLAFRGRDLK
jgi:ABC-type transport system involved in multi-copper enzyme maturation permease subunit